MKRLLTLASLMLLVVGLNAQSTLTISGTYTNGGIKLLLTNACVVTGITIINADATNASVATFYDNEYGTNIYTNSAYTAALSYSTNLTLYYTNAQSIITTNNITNAVWTTTTTVSAASNTAVNPTYSYSVAKASVATINGNWQFYRGVSCHLTTNIFTNSIVTLYYRRLL